MRDLMFAGVSALALMLSAQGAGAQTSSTATTTPDAGAAQAAVSPVGEVVVTAHRFLDADTSGITNLPLPVEKVPQSISLVNNAFVNAADLKTMGEIAQYTPGALWASYSPSYGSQVFLRGFAANYAIDGLLVGDQITEPDAAGLERYEIVKGPASVVYGAQSPGGVLNLVSKSAAPDTPNYLEAVGGSWGRWGLEGQIAGALNAAGTIRGIGVVSHEEGGSFVDFVKLNKTVVYGGFDFDLAEGLTAYVRASYQITQDTPYNGIPTFPNGTLVPVSRSYFLGASDITNTTEAPHLDTGVTWKPSALWSFSLQSLYQYTSHSGGNDYPYGLIGYDGSFPVGGEHFNSWHVDDFTIAGTATRKLDDIGLAGSYLEASVRYQHYRYYISELNLTGGTANIFSGDAAVSHFFNALATVPGGYEQDQRMNYLTGSAQAVIKVASPLTLIGGISYSRPDITQQVYNGAFQSYNPGDQVDYRGAVVYEPVAGLNLYASYSESYEPNLRIDTSFNVLPPVQGQQYEVGAKYLLGRRLLLTAAFFDIKENNVAVYDTMVNGEALYQAEDVRHRGAEFEATGQITDHWQIKAGVALLDPKVTDDPQAAINNGETRPWLPKATADLFTTYDFANGLSISGGARYMGSVKTYDNSSATPTPAIHAYTVIDGAIAYELQRWRVQLNLKNIFDEHYYVSTPVFQSLSAGLYPGEPRSITVSVRRDF